MPTFTDITESHSRRLSEIAQRRDSRLHEAAVARDRALRELPAAASLYEAFDTQVAEARSRQLAAEVKAAAEKSATLQEVSDEFSAALADADRVRRDADTRAFEKRRVAEEAAEHEFIAAASASQPSTAAQKRRAQKLEQAKIDFEAALAAAQEEFRKARDKATNAEGKGSRDADRAFARTTTVSEATVRAARSNAEQALEKALAALPQAAEALAAWRAAAADIAAEYKAAEHEAFERFQRELRVLWG